MTANLQCYANYAKTFHDKHLKWLYFEVGQWCMLLRQPTPHKFAPRFKGPHEIIEKISDWNYIVKLDEAKKVVNISKMKLYTRNEYSDARNTANTSGGNSTVNVVQKRGETDGVSPSVDS